MPKKIYFTGLDALRFFAAFLVLLMHAAGFYMRMIGNLPLTHYPILYKGHTAVSFFFVLSGFLITYLMFKETRANGRVEIKRFYLKRVYRIWPLYFLVIFIGFITYFYVLPHMGIITKTDFNLIAVMALYVFFLPNVCSSFFNMGAILGVTWSIGVEEQFYLFWAPLFNRFKNNSLKFFTTVFVIFFMLQVYSYHFVNNVPLKAFFYTLQFNNMAIGAIAAYLYFTYADKVHNWAFFKLGYQLVIFVLLAVLLFVVDVDHYNPYYGLLYAIVYVYIIVNCVAAQKSIFKIRLGLLNYMGKISFGIYMYHSIFIYVAYYGLHKLRVFGNNPVLFFTAFIVLASLLTFAVSALSYEVFEKRFLTNKLKSNNA
jgi:peptidoglycan/LPS O-acetylase OafA/YrhL